MEPPQKTIQMTRSAVLFLRAGVCEASSSSSSSARPEAWAPGPARKWQTRHVRCARAACMRRWHNRDASRAAAAAVGRYARRDLLLLML
jgi:hypothetical protein